MIGLVETRNKMKESWKLRTQIPSMLGKKHSPETIIKMKVSAKGRVIPKWQTDKATAASVLVNTGRVKGPHTEDAIARISKGRKGKGTGKHRETTCPHCGKEGGDRAMKRYHFDNCKHKEKAA